jgi:hypothetical protein
MNNNAKNSNKNNEARKAAMWDEIVGVVKMLPCFSEEMDPDHFDETVGQIYDVLYEQPENLDQRLERVFVARFNTSRVATDVMNNIIRSPKNTPQMGPLLKPLFKGSSNLNITQLSPTFRRYLGSTDPLDPTRLKSDLLNKFMATKVFQDAFKKLLLIKLPEKSIIPIPNNASKNVSNNGSNNNTIVPSYSEGELSSLEEEPVSGGAKKRKQRELLKTKTVEQLRRMMRRAGKKCSRKGVALRKSQLISALLH